MSGFDNNAAGHDTLKVLVYYPAFPVYRRTILECLAGDTTVSFSFAAGTVARANLTPLTKHDLPELTTFPTRQLGPITWNPGALREALDHRYHAVIIAPATTSLTVWAVTVMRRLRKQPVVLWGQCGKPGARGAKRFAQELLNRLATALMVYGESEREAAAAWGTDISKIQIVYNASGDDVRDQSESIPESNSGATDVGSPVTITYVGRVTAAKRLDVLIEATEILRDALPSVRALIVGGGDDYDRLRKRASTSVADIELTGPIHDPSEIRRIFESTAIVCAPVEMGLLALDAIRHSKPVLVPDNKSLNGPEVEAIVPGITGAYFRSGDPHDLARAVLDWLSSANRRNPAAIAKASSDALRVWSAPNVAERIRRTVSRLAEGSSTN